MSDSKLFKKREIQLNNESFVVSLPKRSRSESAAADATGNPSAEITHSDLAKAESRHIIEEAENDARAIVAEAKNSAESIILEAYDRAEEIRKNAEREGYDAGRAAADAEYQSRFAEMTSELSDLKKELLSARERLFREVEHEAVNLALLAVENILGKKTSSDENLISTLVNKAVAGLTGISHISVRISSSDAEQAESIRTKLMYGADRIESVDIKIDEVLPKGSCIVETDRGIIDSSIDRQLARLKTDVLQLLGDMSGA